MKLPPGIYYDVSDKDYHADCAMSPSLSRSIAWELISKSPAHAWLKHPRLNPNHEVEDANAAMDFGQVGHELLLGKEASIIEGAFKDYKTDAAKKWRDTQRESGKLPVLNHVLERADEMVKMALCRISDSGFIKDFLAAKSEVTVITGEGDKTKRARFDKLLIDPDGAKDRQHGEHAIAFDLKITKDVNPENCANKIANMGYDLQEHFYCDVLTQHDPNLAGRIRFVFLFIEDHTPFAVTPIELGGKFRAMGSSRYNRAVSIWETCMRSGHWPTYCDGEGSFTISPPTYAAKKELENEEESLS